VDLAALRENLAWIRHHVGPAVKILTVVKADAYGHGLSPIAALLMQSGADVFGVASLAEARSIRAVGRGWPVLMLGACLPNEIEEAVRDDLRPTLSTVVEAEAFAVAATRARKSVRVHVKVDTGMGRLGAQPEEALPLLQRVMTLPGLELEGCYTHLAAAEDDREFTRRQLTLFQRVLAAARAAGISIPLVHAANSAAVLHEPEARFNFIRPGLLVYGIAPPGRRPAPAELRTALRPALVFKCRVSLVKEIAKGTSLSYGHTFIASRRMRVATLTTGYGDGYPRAASSRASLLIGGKRCRVLGRVTMDQLLADVSQVDSAAPGDEAVLIGRQGDAEITATELAAWSNTIPWDIVTGITQRVPRLYRGATAA